MTREEAITVLNMIEAHGSLAIQAKDMAINALKERKAGHWIEVTNGRGGHECDICHEYAPSYKSGDEYLTKYCPNCGARMVGEQE